MTSKFGAQAPIPASPQILAKYGQKVQVAATSSNSKMTVPAASTTYLGVPPRFFYGLALLAFLIIFIWCICTLVASIDKNNSASNNERSCSDSNSSSSKKVKNPYLHTRLEDFKLYDAYGIGSTRAS